MNKTNTFNIYIPREDSFLLQQFVQLYAEKAVLEIGVGSGIQAFSAATKKETDFVIGVDINKEAIAHCKKLARYRNHQNILFLQSNLFQKIAHKAFMYDKKKDKIFVKKENKQQQFDTIIFNPPYLPEDGYDPDPALIGGKQGYELIERFLQEAAPFLKNKGRILLLFSSKTKKDKIDVFLENNLLQYTLLEEKYIGGFETLFIYAIQKTTLLQELEKKGITTIQKIAKGHRGDVYTGIWNKQKIAIKKQRDLVKTSTIHNEIKMLERLNKKNIGPKLLFAGEDFFVCEYIEGKRIEEYLEHAQKSAIKKVLRTVFKQCFLLDQMHLNKEEMHHPYKHVIVRNNTPIMIDFERCGYSQDQKNVTQFCQYVTSQRISKLLERKGFTIHIEKIRIAAKEYKTRKELENVLKTIFDIKK